MSTKDRASTDVPGDSTSHHNICGARRSDGSICTMPAGRATNHPGVGYCWKHDVRDAGMKDARILEIVARSPDLALRAQAYLDSDRELLNARRELAVLKARFETLRLDQEEDADVPRLCQLANTISLMTRRIQDIEIARKHYIHIDVLTRFTADFSRIGQAFFPDIAVREKFINALEASIRDTIPKSNARGIAARMLTRDAENVIVDVEDYEVGDMEGVDDTEDTEDIEDTNDINDIDDTEDTESTTVIS